MTQGMVENYKREQNQNPHVLYYASKSEGFSQDIAYQIYANDRKLNQEKLDNYVAERKISDYDRNLFEMLINAPVNPTFWQKVLQFFGIPI